jgi:hypothetical protein
LINSVMLSCMFQIQKFYLTIQVSAQTDAVFKLNEFCCVWDRVWMISIVEDIEAAWRN